MTHEIIESGVFTDRVLELLDPETYRKLQSLLLDAPDKGDVMPGCGGLRKLRIEHPARGKGTRGGCRVIYLHIPDACRIALIAIYSKGEQEDLNNEQKKVLKALADRVRSEVSQAPKKREHN